MSVFTPTLATQLKQLSKGKTLQIETTDRYVAKESEEYKNAIQQNFTFWMDNETGELCCKNIRFLGERPNEYDEEESYVHKGQDALALLYKYGFLDIGTFKQGYLPGEPQNKQVMSLGLAYIIEIMEIVDSKVPRKPHPTRSDWVTFSRKDVVNMLLHGHYISLEDFSKSFNKTPLNLEDVIIKLEAIANNTLVRQKIYGIPDHLPATDEVLYGPKHNENPNIPIDENFKNKDDYIR